MTDSESRQYVRRRPPAYAKDLVEARRRGMIPERLGFGHVAVVLDWREQACAGLPRLVCAPDDDPRGLDFRCLVGLEVLLSFHARDAGRAAAAVAAMLDDGAAGVWAWNLDLAERIKAAAADRVHALYGQAQCWYPGGGA